MDRFDLLVRGGFLATSCLWVVYSFVFGRALLSGLVLFFYSIYLAFSLFEYDYSDPPVGLSKEYFIKFSYFTFVSLGCLALIALAHFLNRAV